MLTYETISQDQYETYINTQHGMTQEQELAMFEELLQNHIEMYHEEEDFDPSPYEIFLETCTDDEFVAEYERVFGDA